MIHFDLDYSKNFKASLTLLIPSSGSPSWEELVCRSHLRRARCSIKPPHRRGKARLEQPEPGTALPVLREGGS